MTDAGNVQVCRSCGFTGSKKYCGRCGQAFKTKRITLPGLLHDVFHFFTHLDKGFGYTLKQLAVAPGKMQTAYLEGDRARHQKPFSMFFICATIAGLGRYWIYLFLIQYYNEGNVSEAKYFHEYLVLLQIVLMPFNVLLTYLFFYRSKYNYAEIGVLVLYNISFFFLIVTIVALLRFIWPGLDTAYIEFPFLIIYNGITFLNFFKEDKPWLVLLKSILLLATLFFITQVLEDWIIKIIT